MKTLREKSTEQTKIKKIKKLVHYFNFKTTRKK